MNMKRLAALLLAQVTLGLILTTAVYRFRRWLLPLPRSIGT
jgi:hypothetical protein